MGAPMTDKRTNSKIQKNYTNIQIHKYTNTKRQIHIRKYKYTNTNTRWAAAVCMEMEKEKRGGSNSGHLPKRKTFRHNLATIFNCKDN